jgi:hypothetical protein
VIEHCYEQVPLANETGERRQAGEREEKDREGDGEKRMSMG